MRFDAERLRLGELGLERSGTYSIARIGRETAEVYRRALAA
jgi:hypothetical protein